jgi:hypothetical protein
MPRIKKAPQYRYGIEITKPFSTEMYDHNDAIALDMKRNILSEIHLSYSNAMGTTAGLGDEDDNEARLRKIGSAIEGSGYGEGFELDEIKDNIINSLANVENWYIHQEYGYLCSEGIVPKLPMKMLGFDKAEDGCWDCYWEEEDGPIEKVQYDDAMNEIPGFEGTLEALDNLTTLSQSNEDLIKRHNTKLSSERMKDNPKFELSPNQLKNLIKEELKKDIK